MLILENYLSIDDYIACLNKAETYFELSKEMVGASSDKNKDSYVIWIGDDLKAHTFYCLNSSRARVRINLNRLSDRRLYKVISSKDSQDLTDNDFKACSEYLQSYLKPKFIEAINNQLKHYTPFSLADDDRKLSYAKSNERNVSFSEDESSEALNLFKDYYYDYIEKNAHILRQNSNYPDIGYWLLDRSDTEFQKEYLMNYYKINDYKFFNFLSAYSSGDHFNLEKEVLDHLLESVKRINGNGDTLRRRDFQESISKLHKIYYDFGHKMDDIDAIYILSSFSSSSYANKLNAAENVHIHINAEDFSSRFTKNTLLENFNKVRESVDNVSIDQLTYDLLLLKNKEYELFYNSIESDEFDQYFNLEGILIRENPFKIYDNESIRGVCSFRRFNELNLPSFSSNEHIFKYNNESDSI